MDNEFNNKVGKRREGGILFEPPEPLFPEYIPRKRRLMPRLVALIVLIGMGCGIWGLAVSGRDKDGDGEDNTFGESTSQNTGDNGGMPQETESLDNTENITESKEKESVETLEKSTESREEVSGETGETESISDIVTERDPLEIPIELDLSATEKGESHIINYSSKAPDVSGLVDRGFVHTEKYGREAPLVMVIHTHTSEGYFSEKGETSVLDGVAAVGDVLNTRLNSLGLSSIHCTVIHDSGEGNAYLEARKTIETMLKIYPSIKYVIDLHRMVLSENGSTVKTVSGVDSAQIRLSVSADSGEWWQESLSLALAVRGELNEEDKRLCMPAVVSQSRYNSDLCDYYVMVDIGSSGNTVGEACAAARHLAEALAIVILE